MLKNRIKFDALLCIRRAGELLTRRHLRVRADLDGEVILFVEGEIERRCRAEDDREEAFLDGYG